MGSETYGGTILIATEDGTRRSIIGRDSMLRERALPSIRWILRLLSTDPSLSTLGDGYLYFQFEDYALNRLPSIAYGRRVGSHESIRLVPDSFFVESRGFQVVRQVVRRGELPRWSDRENVAFWRGSTSHDDRGLDQQPIREPKDIPRVALCILLASSQHADVGLQSWQIGQPSPHVVEEFLSQAGLRRPFLPMLSHAKYKFLIDVDGYANAWSLLEKFLLGSCVLKIASRYEQWFYSELAAWTHYVPVKEDLSDLVERLDWCLTHDREAEQIAQAGQLFAMRQTCEAADEWSARAVASAFLPK